MAFKKFEGRGFILYIDGPSGPDGRKRETTPVSCRAEDLPEVLKVLMGEDKWVEQDESLVPPDAARMFARPSHGKKNYTLIVRKSDYVQTVFFVPDQKTNGAGLMPGKDQRDSLADN